jgi:hypothetical protein
LGLGGDLDSDGLPEILVVGSERGGGESGGARGRIFAFSGKDGHLLEIIDPPLLPDKNAWEKSGNREGFTAVLGAVDLSAKEPKCVVVAETCEYEPYYTGNVLFLSMETRKVVRGVHRGSPRLAGGNSRFVGDLDLDGARDIAVFAQCWESIRDDGASRVRVFSARTMKQILEITLATGDANPGEYFPSTVADAGDINRDGSPEIAMGFDASSVGGRVQCGRVDYFSGKDGTRLRRIEGSEKFGGLGASLASPGDLDGDGVRDLVVGANPNHGQKDPARGAVTAYSGKDGKVLWSFSGAERYDHAGEQLAALGDINGDGVPDIAVYCGTMNEEWSMRKAKIHFVSGKDGKILRTIGGKEFEDRDFGRCMAACGDVDNDGVTDLAVGVVSDLGPGAVEVYSVKTGALLRTLRQP